MTTTQTAAESGAVPGNSIRPGATLWLTGLPSAGKTTLARALIEVLADRGVDTELLDGDEVRTHLSAGLGFSKQDRDTQVTRIGFVAELLARHGVLVLVPVIAPYADARDKVRAQHAERGTPLLQVHLSTPIDVCADRDVKGLYAKAFRGEISSMTGVDDPYEVPVDPDLRIDTSAVDRDASVALLLNLLAERGLA
ncbi:MAG TPA: adenylyl-sulfate kinase [Nakamurella sp.]